MAGDLSYFEFGTPDVAVASTFFTELFGWKVQAQEHGGSIDTGSAVPGGMHRDPGPPQHYLYFAVDDIEAAMKRVVELGGEVEPMRPPTEQWGAFVECRDNQGLPFGLHLPPKATP
ncbi:VOC family protein [Salinispora fenicalii]|uniref:VOC family protein n=1 Tax=Salinispora fenicalii TaxID=1137263 RepID=UPI000485AE31|nr:VOC family protein [Salinispora fenicalii]